MAINPAYARSMMGQWVKTHSAYGIHHGILHQVRPDGIVLAIPRGSRLITAGRDDALTLNHADNGVSQDVIQAQFFRRRFFDPFFFFFFFIPFFFLFDFI